MDSRTNGTGASGVSVPTATQKLILGWMMETDGRAIIEDGRRTIRRAEFVDGASVIETQRKVVSAMLDSGLIEIGDTMFRVTPEGAAAIGRDLPVIETEQVVEAEEPPPSAPRRDWRREIDDRKREMDERFAMTPFAQANPHVVRSIPVTTANAVTGEYTTDLGDGSPIITGIAPLIEGNG